MEGPLLGSPWLAPISSVMTSCLTKDSLTIRPHPRRLGPPLVCVCTLTAGLGNLIKMCLLWIIVQSSSERETVMVLRHVNKNEVCEGPSYCCQNLIFSTFCFRSLKPTFANLSGKFSNEVQVCFAVDNANKSNSPWFHQWRTRSAILIGVNNPCIISVIKI